MIRTRVDVFVEFVETSFIDLKARISANIQRNGQRASGATEESMHPEKTAIPDGLSIALVARPGFENLQKGNPPGAYPDDFILKLYQWSIAKGLSFPSVSARKRFANSQVYLISTRGDKLYQQGGRDDVYTPEIPQTLQQIEVKADELVVEITQSITIL